MWGVIGLGNPGLRYAATRHNLGYMVVDVLADRCGATLRHGPGPYEWAEVELGGKPALLVKPTTYVNRTGDAVEHLSQRFALAPERLLAIVDDVHLPFARLRVRPSGSAGGHNGLRSIEESLESSAYPRLRLGIGPAAPGQPLPDHVLSGFSTSERRDLDGFVVRAADAVECIVVEGLEATRERINAPDSGTP